MNDILEETLARVLDMRRAIALRYRWYYHVTPTRNAPGIKARGIIPMQDESAPPIVLAHFGPEASKIVCLNPLGTDIVAKAVSEGPFVCLAISTETLPQRIGLDWSYGGAVELAQILRNEQATRPADEIFVEAVKRRGSVISYDAIGTSDLRVCCKKCPPHDPSSWPLLTATDPDQMMEFAV